MAERFNSELALFLLVAEARPCCHLPLPAPTTDVTLGHSGSPHCMSPIASFYSGSPSIPNLHLGLC